jgi:glycerol-3-phosphate acyltransferase PlsX
MIKDGTVEALVTAGNTGAFMAAGMFVAGRIDGIERPALAPLFPTENGRGVVVLDVGANMDAKPHHLLQYGVMGSLYAERVLGRENPKVALLNVGAEPGKGNQATKEAYSLLAAADINFVGNLEARDLIRGTVDVVVCDGFTGNVVLKFMEGMSLSLFSMMRKSFTRDSRSKVGALLLKPALRDFRDSLDYSEYGGAPLLGLKGILVKCHGSSNARAIKNGIYQAQKFVEQDVVRAIEASAASKNM